ncbi:hypothetical protein GGR55DRAFT_632001 [Xylaria sp. FL0064]|nr:hypothetical protein GGR55DRAFT_632001 [Xylaria sp. FL0064]
MGYSRDGERTMTFMNQHRFATRVVLPHDWCSNDFLQRGVTFLQLSSPLEEAMPITHGEFETHARQQLTVVGFATDLISGGEPGARMYKMALDRELNITRTMGTMLRYEGDLQGGQLVTLISSFEITFLIGFCLGFSGALVIRESDLVAVGVHIQGGTFNTTELTGGPYSVRFPVYEQLVGLLKNGSGPDFLFEIKPDTNQV